MTPKGWKAVWVLLLGGLQMAGGVATIVGAFIPDDEDDDETKAAPEPAPEVSTT